MSTPNYTAAELRQCADAVEAQAAGKPVQQMHPISTHGEWLPLDANGITVCRGWRYRPAPEPTVIPWTRETLPPLPIVVVYKDSGDRACVVRSAVDSVGIAGEGKMTYPDLLRDFTLPDGSPCGEVKA